MISSSQALQARPVLVSRDCAATVDQMFDKLRPFYWVPCAAPWNKARGPFRWSGEPIPAWRHPTRDEFSRFLASVSGWGQHFDRSIGEEAAARYSRRYSAFAGWRRRLRRA